jgi:copper chaperone CopZ
MFVPTPFPPHPRSWFITDSTSLAWSFFVIAAMGFSRHFLSFLRRELALANLPRGKLRAFRGTHKRLCASRYLACGLFQRSYALLKLVDALIFAAYSTLVLLNMLVVMTFNPYLMLGVVVGEMAGHVSVSSYGRCDCLEGGDSASSSSGTAGEGTLNGDGYDGADAIIGKGGIVELSIGGMTCDSCVNTVEKALRGVKGVQSASVSLKARTARVRYDANRGIDVGTLISAVEDTGFEASAR